MKRYLPCMKIAQYALKSSKMDKKLKSCRNVNIFFMKNVVSSGLIINLDVQTAICKLIFLQTQIIKNLGLQLFQELILNQIKYDLPKMFLKFLLARLNKNY